MYLQVQPSMRQDHTKLLRTRQPSTTTTTLHTQRLIRPLPPMRKDQMSKTYQSLQTKEPTIRRNHRQRKLTSNQRYQPRM